ncbi:MAG: kinase/pyrophosphorylase, partial [Minwuiales bacterium]|nr:kinase/pyrophosphorylase [Minwuiales bacterium]
MTKFHLHLVSDATGETLDSITKAALVQFSEADAVVHMWSLVRAQRQLDQVLVAVENHPGIVLFTLVDADLRRELEEGCRRLQVPCVAVLD